MRLDTFLKESEGNNKKTTLRSLTLEDGDTCVSPTLIDKTLKFSFKFGCGIVDLTTVACPISRLKTINNIFI